MRAVVFVQPFQPGGQIHGIAERRIPITQRRTHVAHAGHAGVQADADIEMRLSFRRPLFLQLADAVHHLQCGFASLRRVPRFFEGRAPESHDRVADIFIERAVVIENQAGHVREVLVQKKRQFLGVEFFRNRREAPNIAEHHGDFRFLWLDQPPIHEQSADHFRAEVLAERRAHAALFLFFNERPIKRNQQNVGRERHRGHGEVEPPAVQKRPVIHPNQRRKQESAKPHPARRYERHPDPQRNAESENQQHVDERLFRASPQEAVVEDVVHDVGVDFHPGKIRAAKGRCAEVSDPRGRCADQHQLPPECSRRTFSLENIRDRVVRKSSPRALVVDKQLAAAVGVNRRLASERNLPNARRAVEEIAVLRLPANQGPGSDEVQRGIEIPLVGILRAPVR